MTVRKPSSIDVARPVISLSARRAVNRVLRTGRLAQGAEVAAFEGEFSKMVVNGRPSVAVNSGTSGLHLGLLAAGIGPGHEVIVPSFTFAATANSVAMTGATPVFADISLDTYCLEPASVEAAISSRTAAIMPVHLYGRPAPMNDLVRIARQHGIKIFEDASQAHMAEIHGQRAGTFGEFAVFSFYPTKNMTSGEGGIVVCQTEEFARKVRLLRNQGMEQQYQNEVVGLNNRMTDIHAAIGRDQLRRLPKWTQKRQENAEKLSAGLRGVIVPERSEDVSNVYHQYTIRVPSGRDELVSRLKSEFGIGTGVYYPTPNHLLPSLSHFPTPVSLDKTVSAAKQVLSLPVHPHLTGREIRKIIDAVNECTRG